MSKLLIHVYNFVFASAFAGFFVKLGIGLATYSVIATLASAALNHIKPMFSGLPQIAVQFIILGGIPEAFGIVGSAYLTVATIKAVKPVFVKS